MLSNKQSNALYGGSMNQYELAISSVKIAAQILHIPAPKVLFINKNQFPNIGIRSVYVFDDNIILINSSWIFFN
jgi:hypothetical protein